MKYLPILGQRAQSHSEWHPFETLSEWHHRVHTKMCERPLHADEIYSIMYFLSTEDVLRCMQVCKYWKASLMEEIFWKKYIRKRFDLRTVTKKEELEGPLYQWSDPENWFCYYKDDSDAYVLRPFPPMLKCGVIIPFGLDLMSFDTKHLEGLSRSLEILTYMRKGVKTFELSCGNECSPNEGCNELSMVLIPWDNMVLPTQGEVFGHIFHFHPEIMHECPSATWFRTEKLYFHVNSEHDKERRKETCLNGVFGRSYHIQKNTNEELEFFTWLQNIMVPTCMYIAGEGKLNPVVEFFVTTLAPGWVGGILTGQIWT